MHSFFSLSLLIAFWVLSVDLVDAQLVNGQFFTRGLAISNAPAPDSEFTVGGTISVSVDVSGNGRLPSDSWGPNSQLETGFQSLSLFLVSNTRNVTIVDGTTGAFLAGEPGSTVKHLNYVIPSCLEEGTYDYTYYEMSRMNGTTFFGITPISIRIRNPQGSSGNCDPNVTNQVQQRPQNDSAAPVNPFTGGLALDTSSANSNANAIVPPPASTATPRQDQVPNTSPTTARFIPTATMNAQAALNVDLTFPIRRNSSSSASSIRLHSLKSLRSLQPINPNWRFSHLANFISNSIFLPSSGISTLSLISLMLGWTLALS